MYSYKEDYKVNKSKLIKRVGLVAATAMLPLSQAAIADGNWGISGWINEGVTYYDTGESEGLYQSSENGHTLGSRVTLSGSTDLPNSGLSAGFELIIEPQSTSELLGSGSGGFQGSTFGKESVGGPDPFLTAAGAPGNGHDLTVLGNSLHVSGGFGKVTVGLQSMPTDNIAVLEDPSLTLWSAISPVFVGNGTLINGGNGATWGNFLTCGSGIGGIGIDCNGIYRKGVRYDLPAFGPVTVAVGAANNDVYDIAAKYKGQLGGVNTQLAIGYATLAAGNAFGGKGTDNFQLQAGAMDPNSGIFGSIAYQNEDMDSVAAGLEDSTDAWWLKVGIKKAFNSLGDTSFSFNYGQYNDQNNFDVALSGSEVERMGVEVNQYFGSRLIIYGVWENLDLDVDGTNSAAYSGADDLDTFRTGLTFFF
jgi:porin-like protein